MEAINKLKRTFFNRQFIMFVIIGVVNTLSSTIFSSIYSMVLKDIPAFIVGYGTGIIVSYILNTLFTFKARFSITKLLKFSVSTLPNFIIQLIVVTIGVRLLGINNVICYGMAAIIGVPVTFVILKLFVYKK